MDSDEQSNPTPLDTLLPSTDSPFRAEFFVHSLAPAPSKQCQDELIERLESLVETDQLEGIDLMVWGNSICTDSALSGMGYGERIVSAIGDFYALTANSDISIAPFFRITTVTSEFTEETFRRIVPPQRCIALYDEEELVAVFPSLIDGVAYTPEDIADHLEQRASTAQTPVPADESA